MGIYGILDNTPPNLNLVIPLSVKPTRQCLGGVGLFDEPQPFRAANRGGGVPNARRSES